MKINLFTLTKKLLKKIFESLKFSPKCFFPKLFFPKNQLFSSNEQILKSCFNEEGWKKCFVQTEKISIFVLFVFLSFLFFFVSLLLHLFGGGNTRVASWGSGDESEKRKKERKKEKKRQK